MPTPIPTAVPTEAPTAIPTAVPTEAPTAIPTEVPTAIPTEVPTAIPTAVPTEVPTAIPTEVPTAIPTAVPTEVPTMTPTATPSIGPTYSPTQSPSSWPSGKPSSQPSSRPSLATPAATEMSLFDKDPFAVPWDYYFIKMKVQKYFFYYAMFFLSIYLFLLLCDISGVIKRYIDRLHESYLRGRAYIPLTPMSGEGSDEGYLMRQQSSINMWGMNAAAASGDGRPSSHYSRVAMEIRKQDSYRWEKYVTGTAAQTDTEVAVTATTRAAEETQDEGMEMSLLSTASAGRASEAGNILKLKGLTKLRSMINLSFSDSKRFTREFQEYLVMRRCKLGCSDFLFPNGYQVPVLRWQLHPGQMEDWLLYLLNNHTIIACVGCAQESDHSRNSRRVVLITSTSIAFFLTNMMDVTLRHFDVSEEYQQTQSTIWMQFLSGQVVDIFIISPLTLVVAEFCKNLYRCNFGVLKNLQNPVLIKIRNAIGTFFSIPILLFCVGLLVLCAIVTTGNNATGNIINFALQIFLVTIILDFIIAIQNFVSEYYFAVYILFDSFCVLSIGQLYIETLIYEQRVECAHFYDLSRTYCYGLLRIDRILEKGYAERYGWVKVRKQATSFMEVNPLHASAAKRRPPSLYSEATSPPPMATSPPPMANNPLSVTKKLSLAPPPAEPREVPPEEHIPAEEPQSAPTAVAPRKWQKLQQEPDYSSKKGPARPTMGVLSPAALSQALIELAQRQEQRELKEMEEKAAGEELELMSYEDKRMLLARRAWSSGAEECLRAQRRERPEEFHEEEPSRQNLLARMSSAVRRMSSGRGPVSDVPLQCDHSVAAEVEEEQWSELFSQSHQRTYWKHKVTGEKTWKSPHNDGFRKESGAADGKRVEEQPAVAAVGRTREVWKERARRASMAPAGMHIPHPSHI